MPVPGFPPGSHPSLYPVPSDSPPGTNGACGCTTSQCTCEVDTTPAAPGLNSDSPDQNSGGSCCCDSSSGGDSSGGNCCCHGSPGGDSSAGSSCCDSSSGGDSSGGSSCCGNTSGGSMAGGPQTGRVAR